jgi:hypothetical protein
MASETKAMEDPLHCGKLPCCSFVGKTKQVSLQMEHWQEDVCNTQFTRLVLKRRVFLCRLVQKWQQLNTSVLTLLTDT